MDKADFQSFLKVYPLLDFCCVYGSAFHPNNLDKVVLLQQAAWQVLTKSILSRLRCITVDVTGTLIAYKGELGDYYCMEAKSEGFKLAYKDMAKKYPCFGFATKMPNVVWWKTCVRLLYQGWI